jgi:hypothetical protein
MSVKDEVNDPWSYVLGGLAGGLAFAVGAIPPLAVAVGAAVLGSKVLAGAFTKSGQARAQRRRERRLPVITRSQEASWLDRAQQAEASFRDIANSAPDGPVAERVRSFGEQVAGALAALDRLAGQASAVRLAISRLDPGRLAAERDRLARTLQDEPSVEAERQRSLASVESQIETYQRLGLALSTLLAKLESGTIGIEGLVARLAEVVALSVTSGATADLSQVDELADELEGLRAGLVETEGVTRQAMEGLAPMSDASPGTVTKPVRRRATE